MKAAVVGAFLILALAVSPAEAAAPSIDVGVSPAGHYVVHTPSPDLSFSGDLPLAPTDVRTLDGDDAVGAFHRVEFDYGGRTSSITAYADLGAVVFTTVYTAANASLGPFPVLSSVPDLPFALSYHDTPFSPYQFNTLDAAADSPWLFFDASANGYLISPATNFPVARMARGPDGALTSSLAADLAGLDGSLTHSTLLVVGTGLNRLFDTWGSTLTALHAKARPGNDADLTLKTLGYWTDAGASYYYHFEPNLGYAGTLLAVRHELEQRHLSIGYLQLDSWWYPKGAGAGWDDRSGGIFRYRAAPDLFPDGLASFRQQVGLPLVTHARWIDPASPYRTEMRSSGNVMTDPRYWAEVMAYLRDSGVVTYEQDWLGAEAQPVYDLTAPRQFLGTMAADASQDGLTLQYCMPLPRHVLQTVEYPNVTSLRVSDDRFDRNRWDAFLYTSRLASAVGVWPWSDVFMSTERDNLLLSVLSAGVVGFGDALGAENVDNLRHAARADGVLIKPDVPLVPTDESMLAEASQGASAPMVAWTYSAHADLRTLYLFAYSRNNGAQSISFTPSSLGLPGSAYVYDYFRGSGSLLGPGEAFTTSVADGTYDVVAPVGPSGIALIGDAGVFATAGQKRISALSEGDSGVLTATLEFASGEQSLHLIGYAASAPAAAAIGGTIDGLAYQAASGLFTLTLHADAAPSNVQLTLSRL